MNISWASLENMARGRAKVPLGCTLEYEFRPSLSWYPSNHDVHEFWKRENPDKHPVDFWHLEKSERQKWHDEYLQTKYRRFTHRPHWACAWQRFTLTSNNNGNVLILQMNSQGHVDELRPVQRIVTVLEVVS